MSRQLVRRAEMLAGLAVAGRRLSTATIMFHQAIADRLGLNVTDHKCIDLLVLKGPLTAGELAAQTGLTTGAITAVIDRLEKAGFACRQDDPNDRRRVIVAVVARRVRDIERLFQPFAAAFAELCEHFNDAELTVILDFMTRSCESLHESTLKLRKGVPSPGESKTARPKRRKTERPG